MITPQGYPLWVVHTHHNGTLHTEPVIAWLLTEGDITQLPVPITPTCGELSEDHGGYLDTEAEVAEFWRDITKSGHTGKAKF